MPVINAAVVKLWAIKPKHFKISFQDGLEKKIFRPTPGIKRLFSSWLSCKSTPGPPVLLRDGPWSSGGTRQRSDRAEILIINYYNNNIMIIINNHSLWLICKSIPGLIELKYFIDCVEAPLTDHKKATNVFLLLAAERGFFDQGRCYLSAETLIDMKDWVTRIRSALEGLQHQGDKEQTAVDSGPTSLPSETSRAPASPRRDTIIPEPLYASIREESIHRSNSLSTLPNYNNVYNIIK